MASYTTPPIVQALWAVEELAGIGLGDKRLEKRPVSLPDRFAEKPQAGIHRPHPQKDALHWRGHAAHVEFDADTPHVCKRLRCVCTDISIPNPANSVTIDVPP